MKTELTRQLRADEGVKPYAYQDSLGLLTIGVGRLIDSRKPGAGLRDDEITYLLNNDIDDRINALGKALPWFMDLDDARKGSLVAMAFQMGTAGLLQFTTTLGLIKDGKYAEASEAMLNSRWATQAPSRAQRLATQMRTGQWVYAPGA